MEVASSGIKIILVGDGAVGKTALLRRFADGEFVEQYKSTAGVEYVEKTISLPLIGTRLKLVLWDTAGQESVNSIPDSFYRGAAVAIVLFSTDDQESFLKVEGWVRRVEKVNGVTSMILCQSKFDLACKPEILTGEAEKLATKLQLPLFRVSAKDNFNVSQLFEFAASMCIDCERPAQTSPKSASVGRSGVGGTSKTVVAEEESDPDWLRRRRKGKKGKNKKKCVVM
uniref:Putative small G-protein n=1 Tax=Trypanosoma congolense (strain IL3000) TaxID=1068625 RepID=G0UX43_TRYCI|nr:putative small G-protein [Trypanosoma congolense IL3000]